MVKSQVIIEEALAAVRKELRLTDVSAMVAPPEQLVHVECELEGMLDDLRGGRVTPSRRGLGRMIVDSWPLNSSLGDRVLAALHSYCKACGIGTD